MSGLRHVTLRERSSTFPIGMLFALRSPHGEFPGASRTCSGTSGRSSRVAGLAIMTVQRLVCRGDSYKVGHQHGSHAASKVKGSIAFYKKMFWQYTGKSWDEITEIAAAFGHNIKTRWPQYFHEMQGIADGAGCRLSDIMALNTRTEIAFGLMKPERLVSDGCTSLAWTTHASMAQNWDWMEEQATNIIFLTIQRTDLPVIKMMTEAGIIGKIGMNSAGVGVCLNAVRCLGNDMTKIPIHLALRLALDSETLQQAVESLEAVGTAGSAYILIGQGDDAVGLEFTSRDVKRLTRDHSGRIMHSNHLVMQHDSAKEWPEDDSFHRLARIQKLTSDLVTRGGPNQSGDIVDLFDDHEGSPVSICRQQEGRSMDATLFNIFMDIGKRKGTVRVGKVCNPSEIIDFGFDDLDPS